MPIVSSSGKVRDRAACTIEASVRQLAAAINFAYKPRKNTLFPAAFVAKPKMLYSAATGDPLHPAAERITAVGLRFGFLDTPDVPSALRLATGRRLLEGEPDLEHATYFLSQITIVPTDSRGMAAWRKKLFVTMARNAASAADYFSLPDRRTITTSGRIHV